MSELRHIHHWHRQTVILSHPRVRPIRHWCGVQSHRTCPTCHGSPGRGDVGGRGLGVALCRRMGCSSMMPYQIRAIDRGPDGNRYARFAETPTGWPLAQCARADPPATVRPPPCAVCGGVERWDDQGTMRCVTCWPLEGSRTDAGGDVDASAPGTTRGDPPCTIDDA